jgi:hypothetical protein
MNWRACNTRPRVVDDTATELTASSAPQLRLRGSSGRLCTRDVAPPSACGSTPTRPRPSSPPGSVTRRGRRFGAITPGSSTAFGPPSQCRWTPLFGQHVGALGAVVFDPLFITTTSFSCDRFRCRHRCSLHSHVSKHARENANLRSLAPKIASTGNCGDVPAAKPRRLRCSGRLVVRPLPWIARPGGRAGPGASAPGSARLFARPGPSQHNPRDDPEHDQEQEGDQGNDPNDVKQGGAPPVGILDFCERPKPDDGDGEFNPSTSTEERKPTLVQLR